MKKQLKTTVMAIALLATVTGAFASDIANAVSGKRQVTYTWQKYLSDGNTPDGTSFQNTSSSNPFPSDCQGGTPIRCVQGTPDVGSPVIYTYAP